MAAVLSDKVSGLRLMKIDGSALHRVATRPWQVMCMTHGPCMPVRGLHGRVQAVAAPPGPRAGSPDWTSQWSTQRGDSVWVPSGSPGTSSTPAGRQRGARSSAVPLSSGRSASSGGAGSSTSSEPGVPKPRQRRPWSFGPPAAEPADSSGRQGKGSTGASEGHQAASAWSAPSATHAPGPSGSSTAASMVPSTGRRSGRRRSRSSSPDRNDRNNSPPLIDPISGYTLLEPDWQAQLDARQFTGSLKAAPNWAVIAHDIDTVQRSQPGLLNAIHVSAAFGRLAHLHKLRPAHQAVRRPPESRGELSLAATLMGHALRMLPAMRPRELATILWSCSVLGYIIPRNSLRTLVRAVTAQLPRCNALDMANATWALSVQLARGAGAAGASALEHADAAVVAAAATRATRRQVTGGAPPGPEPQPQQQQGGFLEAAAMPGQQGAATSGDVMRRGGEAGEGEEEEVWLEEFVEGLVSQLPHLPARPFIVIANSLAKLPQSCLQYEHAVRVSQLLFARTAAYSPHDMVNALCTLARLEMQPSSEWMVTRMMEVSQLLTRFKPDEACLFLYACARLRYRPGDVLLTNICRFTAGRLSAVTFGHLALLPWSMAQLGVKPPHGWLALLAGEAAERVHEAGGHELGTLLHGLVSCGYVPDDTVTEVLVERVELLLQEDAVYPWALSNLVWSLPLMRVRPQPRTRAAITSAVVQHMGAMTNAGLCNVLWALARLRRAALRESGGAGGWDYPDPFVAALAAEVRRRLPTLSPTDLPMALWGLARLGDARKWCTRTWMVRFWDVAGSVVTEMSLPGFTALVHATTWLRHALFARQYRLLRRELERRSASLDPRSRLGLHSRLKRLRRLHAEHMDNVRTMRGLPRLGLWGLRARQPPKILTMVVRGVGATGQTAKGQGPEVARSRQAAVGRS